MRVQPLLAGKVAQAYPIIQLLRPGLSLEGWYDYAMAHLDPTVENERGILTVEDEQGTILAMLAYTVDPDLMHGRALIAKEVLAVTPFQRPGYRPFSVLFEAIESVAEQMKCAAVHTRLQGIEAQRANAQLRTSLLRHGHEMAHFVFSKNLGKEG